MSFKKREEPKSISQARTRLSGMKKIDTDQGKSINYGGDNNIISAAEFEKLLNEYAAVLEDYNQILQQADTVSNNLDLKEKMIKDMFTSVLKSASAKFGANSNEIEVLGGTRKEDRKAPTKNGKVKPV